MAIDADVSRIAPQALGNGVTTVFPFTFRIQESHEVEVTQTVILTDVATVLGNPTSYTVTMNADQDNNPGGNVIMVTAPATGLAIDIKGKTPLTQPALFSTMVYPETLNKALDRLLMQIKELSQNGVNNVTYPGATFAITFAETAVGATIVDDTKPPGNIIRYGADRLGVADSHGPIDTGLKQATFPGGVACYAPAGTYLNSARITINALHGPLFYGDGIGQTIIKSTLNNTFLPLLFQRDDFSQMYGGGVMNMSFDHNGGGQLDGSVVQFNGVKDFIFVNVEMYNATATGPSSAGCNGLGVASGTLGGADSSGIIINPVVHNCSKAAVNLTTGANGVQMFGGHFYSMSGNGYTPGLQVNGGVNITADGTHVEDTEGPGVLISDGSGISENIKLSNFRLRRTALSQLVGSHGVTCSANAYGRINNVSVKGFDIEDVGAVIGAGPSTNAACAMSFYQVDGLEVKDNRCGNAKFDGISVDTCKDFQVQDNRCWGNNDAGITYASGLHFRGALQHGIWDGNQLYDRKAVPTQSYGIIVEAGCTLDDVTWGENHTEGNTVGPVLCSGTLGRGKYNIYAENKTINVAANPLLALSFKDNTAIQWRTEIIGKKSDSTTSADFSRRALLRRQGGTLVQTGATRTPVADENGAAYAVPTFVISSPTCTLTANGIAATTIDWRSENIISVV